MSDDVYRKLQQHLDTLPVPFPPTDSGAEIRILKHLFTPEEANIASKLKFHWNDLEPFESINNRLKPLGYSKEDLERYLDSMASKGAIMSMKKDGKKTYGNALLIVGIYEFQVNKLTKEFIKDFHEYFNGTWLTESSKVPVHQLRTIPIGVTIDHEANISHFDDVKSLIENADPPYVIINCVCRQTQDILGNPCKNTSRREVCMGLGTAARIYIDNNWGREISKEEALEILKKNEEEGMIFQSGNTQKADFICSCCACCCEGTSKIYKAPDPAILVATNFYAEIDQDVCTGCQACLDRCQMDAIENKGEKSSIMKNRCIGCGNCIYICPSDAIKLIAKAKQHVPPFNGVELYEHMGKVKEKVRNREKRRQKRLTKRQQN
ncbi:MAG: indolepyruvate ferredoxin oxidoreductase subunit alpha [Promethearchaeota archaeon]